MSRHPEPHIRRAVRVLAMVGELHKVGYQKLRVMPYMSPSGIHWRCEIGPANFFYRNPGAILAPKFSMTFDDNDQAKATIARYSSADENRYFGWDDAKMDNARSLADKFIKRFCVLADSGKGWDYRYAGWYEHLLGLAEAGWLPVVLRDYGRVYRNHIPVDDVRPAEWRRDHEEKPRLPAPPSGKLDEDYEF
jgi:hypothetical protein